jgi:uncharacterized protein (DUF433 family)
MTSTEHIPLVRDADGVVRIGSTRVTLDSVVAAFREGLTAEAIAEQYPSLPLSQVYSVIGYVLGHPNEVDAYLTERNANSQDIRADNERRFSPNGLRARLLARKSPR